MEGILCAPNIRNSSAAVSCQHQQQKEEVKEVPFLGAAEVGSAGR